MLVTTAPGPVGPDPDALREALDGAQASVHRLADDVSRVQVPPHRERVATEVLTRLPGVLAVERDRYRPLTRTPNDPGYPAQWAHRLTGAPRAWEHTVGDRAVRVAVLDGGVDATLPDLRPNVVEQVRVVDGGIREVASGGGVDNDVCASGHGTASAGVLGAVGDNGHALAGVAWRVSVFDVGLVDADATGCTEQVVTDSAAIAGMRYALEHPEGPVDVVNLSFGAGADVCPLAWQTVVDDARARGTVVVAAAGNGGRSEAAVPAACNGVVAVGAATADGGVAPYSDRSPHVDLLAPAGSGVPTGEGLVATLRDPGKPCGTPISGAAAACGVAGTSFAAPYVAGVAALLRSVRPTSTVQEVEGTLEATASHPHAPGARDAAHGWGVVHAGRAIELAVRDAPLPRAQPDPRFPVEVPRLDSGSVTRPITQALAASRAAFPDAAARHVLLSRADEYADALAGSALAADGPLLYTPGQGPLPSPVLAEVRRVLPRGRTVFVLGGPAAVAPRVAQQLEAAGYDVRRLAGSGREQTAVAVGDQVSAGRPTTVVLVRGYAWPDAVAAAPLAAISRLPVLLARPDHLPAATAEALARWRPERVLVVGSTDALSDRVADQAVDITGAEVTRISGGDRRATAVALAERTRRQLPAGERGIAAVVNLYRGDGWAHVLSVVPLLARSGGVLLPVSGRGGGTVPDVTEAYLRRHRPLPVVVGGRDLVAAAALERLQVLP